MRSGNDFKSFLSKMIRPFVLGFVALPNVDANISQANDPRPFNISSVDGESLDKIIDVVANIAYNLTNHTSNLVYSNSTGLFAFLSDTTFNALSSNNTNASTGATVDVSSTVKPICPPIDRIDSVKEECMLDGMIRFLPLNTNIQQVMTYLSEADFFKRYRGCFL